MTRVTDNFVRANGALGFPWATPVPNSAEFLGWLGTPAGSVLINNNGVGPDATNGLDCTTIFSGGQTWGNDQFVQAVVKSAAGPVATLSITACTNIGGSPNTRYAYTVTGGSVATPISGGFLYVVVTGMQNAANNGPRVATAFGAGTFDCQSGGPLNEAGSTGVGFCSSDSGAGVGARYRGSSAGTLSGYLFHCGSNSFGGGGRKAYYELWKCVNGVGTDFMHCDDGALSLIVPAPGDVIAISVIGSQITAYYNGVILTGGALSTGVYQVTDTDIPSGGAPAITTFAVSGPSQYNFAAWTSGSVQFGGNNGTTLNGFLAQDLPPTQAVLATDAFPYANGDLHTANTNWVYQGSSQFQISSNKVYSGPASANPGFAYRSDVSPTANQYSQVTAVAAGASGGQNCGPAVRIAAGAQTAYAIQYANNLFRIIKYVTGTVTVLATGAVFPVTGDVIVLYVMGTLLIATINGVTQLNATDGSIASGNVGLFGAGNATTNGYSAWSGGNVSTVITPNVTSGSGGVSPIMLA